MVCVSPPCSTSRAYWSFGYFLWREVSSDPLLVFKLRYSTFYWRVVSAPALCMQVPCPGCDLQRLLPSCGSSFHVLGGVHGSVWLWGCLTYPLPVSCGGFGCHVETTVWPFGGSCGDFRSFSGTRPSCIYRVIPSEGSLKPNFLFGPGDAAATRPTRGPRPSWSLDLAGREARSRKPKQGGGT